MQENIGSFTIGQIKTFRGHDNETCMQGIILHAGKRVATWSEDSWGGPHQFDFVNSELEQAFYREANGHPVAVEFAEEMRTKYGKESTSNLADLVVSTIAQHMDFAKREAAQLKRWCKTFVVVKETNAPEGEYIRFKPRAGSYNPVIDDPAILRKYPGCEIINKRFI